jgi:hypothetical protein
MLSSKIGGILGDQDCVCSGSICRYFERADIFEIAAEPGHNNDANEGFVGVGNCPIKGVDLHYHFAKLQLNSLALRGASPSAIQTLSINRKDHANIAISSAIAVLSIILEEPSIRDSLVGVPLYINTMVAFAAVFLLKVTAKWKCISFNVSTNQVWSLVERIIALLNSNSRMASEFHIIPHVANGLDKMLRKCIEFASSNSPVDDIRLWDGVAQEGSMLAEQQHSAQSPGHDPHHGGSGLAAYAVGHGHPQHQQQVWQTYHLQQAPSGAQMQSGMMYSPNAATPPPGMHSGQTGHLYDVNGQYFGMGAFDFLSPQLPY